MERRIKQEIGICVLLMAVSIFVIFVVSGYEDPMREQYKTLRSSFIPVLWASVLGLLSFLHAVLLLMKSRRGKSDRDVPVCPAAQGAELVVLSGEDRRRVGIMVAVTAISMVVYCLLLLKINFFINNVWLLLLTLYVYGERSLKKSVPIAVLGAFGLWLLFVKLMQIPL